MVRIRPISSANQSRSTTHREAAKSIAILTTIFTASHTKKPMPPNAPAEAVFGDENCPVKPRANNIAGTTTTSAP